MRTPMVTWRNRSLDQLNAAELRRALDDALHEIAWSRSTPTSNSFFHALLLGFAGGTIITGSAILAISLLA